MSTQFSTDQWLGYVYCPRTANCWHFARAVWAQLTGVILEEHRLINLHERVMRKLDKPEEPCLVLMERKRIEPHIGVLVRGRVLHCTKHGASYQPLDHVTVGYPTVSFYTNVVP